MESSSPFHTAIRRSEYSSGRLSISIPQRTRTQVWPFPDNTLLRFYDEHKRLKLSIAPSAILYVKSEFNYVQIHYLDGAKVKTYLLRASMKSLENIGSKALTRCQRSYFVNLEHISVLRKDPQGFIFAEMNHPDIEAVPVSKQYYDKLTALL